MNILPVLGVGGLRILQANLNKQASNHTGKTDSFIHFGMYCNAVAAVVSFAYLLTVGFKGMGLFCLLCAFLNGAGFLIEQFTTILAMRRAPLVLCNLCALGGGTVLSSVAGIFFFDEPMELLQWVGVAMFFAAVFLLSPRPQKKQAEGKGSFWSLLLILTVNTVINGLLLIIIKYYSFVENGGNSALFSFFSYVTAAVLFAVCTLCIRMRPAFAQRKGSVFAKPLYLYGGVLGAVCATLCYLLTALSATIPVVILNTIPSVISVVGCAVVGVVFFKEKITLRWLFGVVCGIACAVLIVKM